MNIILHIVLDKVKDIAKIQLVLEPEHELETVLFRIRIPVRPIPASINVVFIFYFTRRDAEGYCSIRLSSNLHQVAYKSDMKNGLQ